MPIQDLTSNHKCVLEYTTMNVIII